MSLITPYLQSLGKKRIPTAAKFNVTLGLCMFCVLLPDDPPLSNDSWRFSLMLSFPHHNPNTHFLGVLICFMSDPCFDLSSTCRERQHFIPPYLAWHLLDIQLTFVEWVNVDMAQGSEMSALYHVAWRYQKVRPWGWAVPCSPAIALASSRHLTRLV